MRRYVYGDESGDFNFSDQQGASRYFILTSVSVTDHAIETDLLALRRELAWEGIQLPNAFHAAYDNRHVRRQMFDILSRHDFRVDATVLEKRKANPKIRPNSAAFYGFAWYYHLAGLIRSLALESDELLIVAASVGTNEMRANFYSAVGAINRNAGATHVTKATSWLAATNPLLQVADYCAWALQRKWERSDTSSYDLIRHKIASEFDVFRESTVAYY